MQPAAAVSNLPRAALAAALLALAIAIAYAGALGAPFLFDDFAAVVENPTIRRLSAPGEVLSPPPNTGVSGRPLVNLSFALNHAVGGLDPRGYHAVNVLLHWLVALALCAVVGRTLQTAPLRARFGTAAPGLSLAAALLWAVHPLLTESVTCIVQRNEILCALFYLLTLFGFLRGVSVSGAGGRAWQVAAVAACWAGMASKEVMVSAPLIVLLADRTFVSGTFAAAWRARRWLYAGLKTRDSIFSSC